MYLNVKRDIENNVFFIDITVDSFGTDQLSEDEERELTRDFPTKIAYRNLTFTKNVKLNGAVPEITDEKPGAAENNGGESDEPVSAAEEAADSGVVTVTLPPLSNRELLVNEEFHAEYKIDTAKIPGSAVDRSVLTTKELVAQAYCLVFESVIVDAVAAVMDSLRSRAVGFAREDLVNV